MRIELTTSSLPRKCSTPELQQQSFKTFQGTSFSTSREPLTKTAQFKQQPKATSERASKWMFSLVAWRVLKMSERRGSNSRPIAWKAIALPTELLPLLYCGERRIRTFEVLRQQSYSLSHLATLVSPQKKRASYRDRTNDLLITSQLLYQLS